MDSNNIFDSLEAVGAFEETKKVATGLDSLTSVLEAPSIVLEPKQAPPVEPVQEVADDPDYDPEIEAEKLIAMIEAGNMLITAPLYKWKVQKNHGGKKVVQRIKTAWAKHKQGQELSEQEQKDHAAYLLYQTERKEWLSEVDYEPEELEKLQRLALPFVKENKMKISSMAAFWIYFGGLQSSKFLKLLE